MTRIELDRYDIVGIRAANPGPFTLSGTNSWVVGRDPAWLVDPGPALGEHLDAVVEEVVRRGGLGGIALTHDHVDHIEALPALLGRFPRVPVAAGRGEVQVVISHGTRFGPLEAFAAPGHSPDHFAFITGRVALTGDAVLGEGSVFIWPDRGALASYLQALRDLRQRDLEVLCPGHGPPVWEVAPKLDQYISHRLERERRLLAALRTGKRSVGELLDDAWDDVPAELRPAAAVTLAAHLDKLEDEGRLPDGVERPQIGL